MMRRRQFITLLGGAVVARPLAARAQQVDRMRRIGMLMAYAESDPIGGQAYAAAFRQGLQQLGWTEGRNIRIDTRWAVDADHLRAYAAELVGLTPEAILACSSPALVALQQVTRTVPIVFTIVVDPAARGFVTSLARPGGNITGFPLYEQSIIVKRLELLKEIAPRVTRVAFIYDPVSPVWSGFLALLKATAPAFGVQVSGGAVHNPAEIEGGIDAFAGEPNGGLIVPGGGLATSHRQQIIALAARHRLPAVYSYRYVVADGGLASYGVDPIDIQRNAASYVDRILKGEKPGDLPIQFPTKYQLVINLKTAKALGLDPPISLIARTDEVIE